MGAVLASGQLETRRDDTRLAMTADALPGRLADVWSGRFRSGLAGSLVEHVDRTHGRDVLRRLLAATTQKQALEILGVTEAMHRGSTGPYATRYEERAVRSSTRRSPPTSD